MPIYEYKAISETGTIIENRVEEINRKSLIEKLKRNNFAPIKIGQVNSRLNSKSKNKKKKNVTSINDIIKDVNIEEYFDLSTLIL